MTQPFATSLSRAALIAVLFSAAGLAACGRRGPLELPPSAQTPASPAASTSGHGNAAATGASVSSPPANSATATLPVTPATTNVTGVSVAGGMFGGTANGDKKGPPPAMDEYGHPVIQAGEKKPFFLDFLLH